MSCLLRFVRLVILMTIVMSLTMTRPKVILRGVREGGLFAFHVYIPHSHKVFYICKNFFVMITLKILIPDNFREVYGRLMLNDSLNDFDSASVSKHFFEFKPLPGDCITLDLSKNSEVK